jgi:hypothetical protein
LISILRAGDWVIEGLLESDLSSIEGEQVPFFSLPIEFSYTLRE